MTTGGSAARGPGSRAASSSPLSDALYLYTNAVGTYGSGWFFDAGWPIAALMIAYAAWLPASPPRASRGAGGARSALPLALAVICLALLVYDHFACVNLLAVALAATALVAVLVAPRAHVRQNMRMLQASRREALTDGLTGLRNRRALMNDLERALADEPRAPFVFGVFDLDGFKQYNDAFGHPAGDALLARLGAALRRSRRVGRPGGAARTASAATSSASSRRRPAATWRRCRQRGRGADRARRGVLGRMLVRLGARARRGRAAPRRRCGWPTSGCTPTSRAAGRPP